MKTIAFSAILIAAVFFINNNEAAPEPQLGDGIEAFGEALDVDRMNRGFHGNGCNGKCWSYCGLGKPWWCYTEYGKDRGTISCNNDSKCPDMRNDIRGNIACVSGCFFI